MEKIRYQNMPDILEGIDEAPRIACTKLLDTYQSELKTARGSSYNHQAWEGGYLDHVKETMNIASVLYESLGNLRPLDFTLSDALVVLFLHDLEKPWKHVLKPDNSVELSPELALKSSHFEFKVQKAAEVGLFLSEEQLNALKYVEGEMDDYRRDKRVMNPLASFCHAADNLSARMWHDYPKENDTWDEAKREFES